MPGPAPNAAPRGRADCTVRALAAVAGISYDQAETIALEAGRAKGRKFTSSKLIEQAKASGLGFRKLRFTGKTLNKFLAQHPSGRFYVRKRRHALAVLDGVVSDDTAVGSIILAAWEFLG